MELSPYVQELITCYETNAQLAPADSISRTCLANVATVIRQNDPSEAVLRLRSMMPERHTTTHIDRYVEFATYGCASVFLEAAILRSSVKA